MSALPGYMTLLDIAKANGSDQVVGLIDETTRLAPEVRLGASRTIKGTSYKTWVRTGLPGTPFRSANQGVAVTKSVYENRVVETFILNPQWEADKAVADRYEFGAATYIGEEAQAIMEGAIQTVGRCFYYGRNTWAVGSTTYGGDAKAFPGLIDQFNTTYEKDATGTTSNGASSLWGVKFGTKNVSWVWGENGQLQMSDVVFARAQDSAGNPLTVYRQELLAYPGLQLGDQRSVCRIKNLTTEPGKGLTDVLIFDVMSLLPAGIVPDMFLCSRRSLTQLRDSRTATNIIGAPAPIPTEVGGIPIFMTDSIADVEPINFLGK